MLKILIPFLLVSTSVIAKPETQSFEGTGIDELDLRNTSGQVKLSAGKTDAIVVATTKKRFSENCELKMAPSGDDFEIYVNAKTRGETCEIDFDIQLPPKIDLELKLGSGSVNISGMEGSLDFEIGSGSLVADGAFRKVEGRSGSGSIKVSNLGGEGELRTGSGSIEVRLSKALTSNIKEDLELRTGSGNAIVYVPKDLPIQTEFQAGSGQLTSEIESSSSAQYKVSMKAGSGNLQIKSY